MDRIRSREAVRIALPAILERLVLMIIATIDTRMISSLGHTAISAVWLTAQPKLLCFAVFYALGTASSFFIAQAASSQYPSSVRSPMKQCERREMSSGASTASSRRMDPFARQRTTVRSSCHPGFRE